MRRYVNASAASITTLSAWRSTAPVMGALTMWQSIHFHSSSKFLGRKQGGSKKLSAAASTTSAPEGAEKVPNDHATSPVTPADMSNDANITSVAQGVGIESQKRVQRERDPRKAMQKHTEGSSTLIQQEKDQLQPSSRQRETATIKRRVDDRCTSASSYSSSVSVQDKNEVSEDDVVAERASITKLFMVSDSVASIFCALPQDQRSIDNYLKEVDQAVIPKPPSERSARDVNAKRNNGVLGLSIEVAKQNVSTAKREIAQRILFEERADHALYIHVRDMEQLVPPCHLLTDGVSTWTSSKRAAGGSRRRGPSKRGKKAPPASSTPTVASEPVSVEQVMALKQWQSEALKKARESQERHQIPEDYHAITRVRFHDPQKADLTVVQGCGGSKSVVDVLAVMNRNLKNENGVTDEDDVNEELQIAEEASTSALLSTPFALKPLLSVVASCIPRREPALGSRCDEETFFRSTPAPTPRKAKKSEGAVNATRASLTVAGSSGTLRKEERSLEKRIPPMPRFTTRVTVLVEHDGLHSMDLLSMEKGRNVAQKEDRKKSATHQKNETHVYCLIADGGEY